MGVPSPVGLSKRVELVGISYSVARKLLYHAYIANPGCIPKGDQQNSRTFYHAKAMPKNTTLFCLSSVAPPYICRDNADQGGDCRDQVTMNSEHFCPWTIRSAEQILIAIKERGIWKADIIL